MPDFVTPAPNVPKAHFASSSLQRELSEVLGLCDKADPIKRLGTAQHGFSYHRRMAHGHQRGRNKIPAAVVTVHDLLPTVLVTPRPH